MSEIAKTCFDRILPRDLARARPARMLHLAIGPTRAAFQIAKLWQNGQTLRVGFLDGSDAQHAQVRDTASHWLEHANLKFLFGPVNQAQVRIAFRDDGAWSYIGTDAQDIPAGQPTMNFGWLDDAVILHEFGHMLGMIHEHQNPRDNRIRWNRAEVIRALSGPPNHWDEATIQHNMFDTYDQNQINGSDFDPDSVMLYSFPASWTENNFHTEKNHALSALDRAFAQRVYPGVGEGAPEVRELSVQEPIAADIGQPGEEDLYRFRVANAGRHLIETVGPTDVVMTLFSAAGQRIAQDDDSGEGRNASIALDLLPGEYQLQVRHYNAQQGRGHYGVSVRKVA